MFSRDNAFQNKTQQFPNGAVSLDIAMSLVRQQGAKYSICAQAEKAPKYDEV